MANNWYPQNSSELNDLIDLYFKQKIKQIPEKTNKIHGLIVPHAGYAFSGEIAGKAFSLLKNSKEKSKIEKAIILSPSHHLPTNQILTEKNKTYQTPLGKIKLIKNPNFQEANIEQEHGIQNQLPFLQKINPNIQILPLLIGQITQEQAKETAEKLAKLIEIDNKTILIISTDLSHFLPYEQATTIDKKTIKIIESLNLIKIQEIDACGIYPLLIFSHLCKLKNWKPQLIEYKNSGDITGEKSGVVGYASFWF